MDELVMRSAEQVARVLNRRRFLAKSAAVLFGGIAASAADFVLWPAAARAIACTHTSSSCSCSPPGGLYCTSLSSSYGRPSPPIVLGLWGVMLGSGVLTLVPYSSVLGLIGLQFVLGAATGALLGAAYGIARELPAFGPLIGAPKGDGPGARMKVLGTFRTLAHRANVAAACLSMFLLFMLSSPWPPLLRLRLPNL